MKYLHKYSLVMILCIYLFSLCQLQNVIAESKTLQVDAKDTPLIIRGILDDQKNTFSGNVQLITKEAKDDSELWMIPTDFHNKEKSLIIINRTHITIPPGIRLIKNQPRDVIVTVSNIMHPGNYSGEIKFLLTDQSIDQALIIPVELRIRENPKVVPVLSQINLEMVRCKNPVDRALSSVFLPKSNIGTLKDEQGMLYKQLIHIQLENKTREPVKILEAAIIMHGEKTGNTINTGDITVEKLPTLPANQVTFIPLLIRSDQISSDNYQGKLRLTVENTDDPVIVNLGIQVRDSPVIPLIIIFLGIIFGRLIKSNETPHAKKQIQLFPRFLRLQANSTKIKHPGIYESLKMRFDHIKQMIESTNDNSEDISKLLDNIEKDIKLFINIEIIENKLTGSRMDALQEELAPHIESARNSILTENREEAEKHLKLIEKRLQQAAGDQTLGNTIRGEFPISFQLIKKLSPAIFGNTLPTNIPRNTFGDWCKRVIAALAGTQIISSEIRFWLIRPLLWFVLLVVLVLLGMQTLYVNAGTTLGAFGLYDYLPLFLWGLSADVAQRTLQNLSTLT